MKRLLWLVVAVNLRTDSFPPSGGVDTIGVPTSTDGGSVFQPKFTLLSGVAQENSTILPLLTFLDSGVVDRIMTALISTYVKKYNRNSFE